MAYTQSRGVFTIPLSQVWDRANNTQATTLNWMKQYSVKQGTLGAILNLH
jgi:hypothetical protein